MVIFMKVLFGTSNEHKIKEVKEIIAKHKLDIVLLSLKDMDVLYDEPIEDGESFLDNAIIKAKYYYEKYQIPVISDDSGLEVVALNGLPGIHSARYASINTYNSSSKDNRVKLLKELENKTNRNAKFTCVVVYYDGVNLINASGEVSGEILNHEQGDNGFGYDSLFYLPNYGKTMAEISEEEKNKLSHRGNAVESLIDLLTKNHIILS